MLNTIPTVMLQPRLKPGGSGHARWGIFLAKRCKTGEKRGIIPARKVRKFPGL